MNAKITVFTDDKYQTSVDFQVFKEVEDLLTNKQGHSEYQKYENINCIDDKTSNTYQIETDFREKFDITLNQVRDLSMADGWEESTELSISQFLIIYNHIFV